jgi:hypothetical protein
LKQDQKIHEISGIETTSLPPGMKSFDWQARILQLLAGLVARVADVSKQKDSQR